MAGDYHRERIFRIWSFVATHNQLILRSEPTAIEQTTTRAEVYFGNVQTMFVRPMYRRVHIREMSIAERDEVIDRFGLDPSIDGGFYRIDAQSADFVVSSEPSWREAKRAFDDPSLFDFDQPWPPSDIDWGTVGSSTLTE